MPCEDSVRVAVRVRPLVKLEADRGFQNVIEKVPSYPQIIVKGNDPFTFNHVFMPEHSQETLYVEAVQAMVKNLFKGYNVTILAYGQTGSGKTHTMGTAFDGHMNANIGVIPRAMCDIFTQIGDMPDYQFAVTCSFMELYQEQLYDLLGTGTRDQCVVDIREDGSKSIVIPGLTEISVSSALETTDCLVRGSSGRAVGATAMNAQSSRSHAIFTLTLQMSKNKDSNTTTTSKFHLVDLAGSERSKKTKATGDRFKEGVKINQGLLALGNVISALGTGQSNGYVGYRDSKLTRLLQDSLGGNSMTLMIACVSPADYNLDESLSTLRYADRAKRIKNKPIVNQDPKAAEINRLNGIIQKLRMELLSKGGNGQSSGDLNISSIALEVMRKNLENLTEKNRKLQQQLQATLHDVADIEMRAVVAETAHDGFHQKILELKKIVLELHQDFNAKTCPPEQQENVKKVEGIREILEQIDGDLQKNKEEMLDNQKYASSSVDSSITKEERESLGNTEIMQRKIDTFTSKQLDFNNELRRLNRELGLKEELHQKVVGNLSKFCSYENDGAESKMKEFESLIQLLEAEKTELLEKLHSVKDSASAKLAEERRKRLNQLEQKIADLRKQNLQQAKLLKVKEKESQKISNLNNEIQAMKAAKVKLIRAMRADSENFRQWKLNREKEVTQLREKDRKRQNEMARMESLHNKQRNVYKRKVEEAMAINKRLKEALEKRKVAQNQHKKTTDKGKSEQILSLVDHELEVIQSVIDAEFSIEQLMEDRAELNARATELRNDPNCSKDAANLEEEIQMRNAQINDLQQKILETDIESKLKTICDGIQSMPEARTALKHLFSAIIDLRKEFATKDNKFDDMRAAYETAEEKIDSLGAEKKSIEAKFLEEIAATEKNYEEKITVLLRELNNGSHYHDLETTPETSERLKIQQESLDKLDSLREELDKYKIMYNELKSQTENAPFKKPKNKRLQEVQVLANYSISDTSFMESEDDCDYDSENDPEWKKTPVVRRKHFSNNSNELSGADPTTNDTTRTIGVKRSSDGTVRCACRGSCVTKQCSCRKNESSCGPNCKCTDACENKLKLNERNDGDDDQKENIQSILNQTETIKTVLNVDNSMMTPKKLSNDDGLTSNLLTPSYPYGAKKKKSFY